MYWSLYKIDTMRLYRLVNKEANDRILSMAIVLLCAELRRQSTSRESCRSSEE